MFYNLYTIEPTSKNDNINTVVTQKHGVGSDENMGTLC